MSAMSRQRMVNYPSLEKIRHFPIQNLSIAKKLNFHNYTFFFVVQYFMFKIYTFTSSNIFKIFISFVEGNRKQIKI